MTDLNSAKQQADDDLTWLARNVHEWPGGDHQPWCYVITSRDGAKLASSVALNAPAASMTKKADWLIRRYELQVKPEPSSDDWHKRGELPPFGKLVRLLFKGDYAYDCEIVAVRGDYVVLWCADAYMSEAIKLEDCRFEPIQTERERVAGELVDVMMSVPVSDRKTASESYMSMALAIYDHLHPEIKP